MKSQETLQILKQIFDLNPETEKVILEKLDGLDEAGEKEIASLLLNYTTKQSNLLSELNKTLIKGKNELEEIVDDSNGQTPEEIIAKI